MSQSQISSLQIFATAIQATGQPDRASDLAQKQPSDRPDSSDGMLGYILGIALN